MESSEFSSTLSHKWKRMVELSHHQKNDWFKQDSLMDIKTDG